MNYCPLEYSNNITNYTTATTREVSNQVSNHKSQIQFQITNQVSNHKMISNHVQICEGIAPLN